MSDDIDKAGLIKPGKPHLLRRLGFLLSSGSNERNYRVGRYLESRKRGKAIPGTKRPRRGTYTGVYATGVNKAGQGMDAIDALNEAIEKAVKFRGQMMSPAQRRAVAMGRSARHVWRERGLTQVRVGGEGGKRRGVRGYQAKTTPTRTQRAIAARLNIRKSEDGMTDAVDDLYDVIEKASKTFRGLRMSSHQRRQVAGGIVGPVKVKGGITAMPRPKRLYAGRLNDGSQAPARLPNGKSRPGLQMWRDFQNEISTRKPGGNVTRRGAHLRRVK